MNNTEDIEIIKTAIAKVEWDYPMEYAAALDKAVEALKEQEPRVLTTDELFYMEHQGVYTKEVSGDAAD